tara:strand:- start:1408 stop:1761 length:354 start_codon:yes stop_codon:yes gene_type:complete
MSADMLKSLEISGWTAVFLLVCYGVYRLILARGLASKCGWFELDLRSKEVRLREIEMQHELDMRDREINELRYKARILKYEKAIGLHDGHFNDSDHSDSTAESGEAAPHTWQGVGRS